MSASQAFLDRVGADLGAAAQSLGVVDSICLGLVAVFALRGFFRGFVRQAAFLASLFLGIFFANRFAERLSEVLPDFTTLVDSGDRLFVAYIAIFLSTLLTAAIVAKLLESTLEALQLRSVDRVLGFAVGASCGAVLVAFLLACGLVFTPRVGPGEDVQRALEDSRSLRWVAGGVAQLRVALPHPFVAHAEEILVRHAEHVASKEVEKAEVPLQGEVTSGERETSAAESPSRIHERKNEKDVEKDVEKDSASAPRLPRRER